ncbi:hypothetical protein [Asticcacaulis machinosus]|uniref:Phytanoyl-CoA dioxygenase (PhyH) n=1 Tax=Asticcacaulis machinosus TaxID=2984211 RepID=A0ABT5HI42_9CAUL|nr:hypothetical protein [Asticcacaulis machinosus]MDC7675913.1 hypothetical protein [Asticcacaulis machinosus]
MSDIFLCLSAADIDAVVRSIDTLGYGVIRNCLPEALLVNTRRFVQDRVGRNGGEYMHFTGSDAVQGTLLEALSQSGNFNRACREIYRAGTQNVPPPSRFHMVLRCLAGKTGQKHAYYFHYDSYVLTALVPVIIPIEGISGDLIMFPNRRKIRRNYVHNLIDKVLLDNPASQWALRFGVRSGWLKPVRLKMEPGNVYMFWGYRTLHTNEPCDVDKIRSTGLMHYADPHAGSWLRQKLGRA